MVTHNTVRISEGIRFFENKFQTCNCCRTKQMPSTCHIIDFTLHFFRIILLVSYYIQWVKTSWTYSNFMGQKGLIGSQLIAYIKKKKKP